MKPCCCCCCCCWGLHRFLRKLSQAVTHTSSGSCVLVIGAVTPFGPQSSAVIKDLSPASASRVSDCSSVMLPSASSSSSPSSSRSWGERQISPALSFGKALKQTSVHVHGRRARDLLSTAGVGSVLIPGRLPGLAEAAPPRAGSSSRPAPSAPRPPAGPGPDAALDFCFFDSFWLLSHHAVVTEMFPSFPSSLLQSPNG